MADHSDVLRVDRPVLFQIVHRAAETPGPGADGAPVVRLEDGAIAVVAQGAAQAHLPALREVRLQVAVIGRGQRVAALQNHLHLPEAGVTAARRLGRMEVDDAHLLGRTHPLLRQLDAAIGLHAMIPIKVQSQERRRRFRDAVGQIQKEVHFRPVPLAGQKHGHFFARGLAAERLRIDGSDLEADLLRRLGTAAVDVLLEQPQQFRPAPGSPGFRVGDRGAVLHPQRIGQRVARHLGLVVVDVLGLRPAGCPFQVTNMNNRRIAASLRMVISGASTVFAQNAAARPMAGLTT